MRLACHKKIFILTALLFLTGVIFFASCAGNPVKEKKGPDSYEDKKDILSTENLEKIPETHRKIIEKFESNPPERIISIAPSITELLYEIGVGGYILGATEPHNYPPEADVLESVGNVSLDMEKIVSLKPDIIIGEKNLFLGQSENLTEIGIPVLLFDTRNVENLHENLRILDLLFKQQKAEFLIKEALDELNLTEKPKKPCRVAGIISPSPMILAAGESYMSSIFELAGCENIIGDTSGDYLTLSREELILRDPEIILYTFKGIGEDLLKDESLKVITAIKENRIIEVDPDIFLRPTLRSISEGAMALRVYCQGK